MWLANEYSFHSPKEITEMLYGSRFVIPSPLQCTQVQNTQNNNSFNLFCGGMTHGLSVWEDNKRCLNKAVKRSPGGVRVVKCRRLRQA
jgi:hypothetical protein